MGQSKKRCRNGTGFFRSAFIPTVAKLERGLNDFVDCAAFWERVGNTLSPLLLILAAGVLIARSHLSLKPEDFWFPMVMIFIEACR